jgi:hypothetical protein
MLTNARRLALRMASFTVLRDITVLRVPRAPHWRAWKSAHGHVIDALGGMLDVPSERAPDCGK